MADSATAGGGRRLDRQQVLVAAVGLLDAEGLTALTMRRLGAALGVEAMSLYRHFSSRAALLDGIVEHLIKQHRGRPGAAVGHR